MLITYFLILRFIDLTASSELPVLITLDIFDFDSVNKININNRIIKIVPASLKYKKI
jgi:hypothetical protein